MSMTSAQIDELRAIADKDTVPYEASDAMYQAADTIWQLRDDLQQAHKRLADAEHDESRAWDRVRKAEAEADRLREENAKLVKVLHEVESEAVDAYLGLQHDCELLVNELDERFRKHWHEQVENDRLRELVRLMVRRHTPISPCKNIPCGECPVKDECDQEDALMRELGIEVGE